MLLKHACQRPPFSAGVFDMSEVKNITDYALDTFFRHYKMYKYVYACRRDLDVHITEDGQLSLDTEPFAKHECVAAAEADPRKQHLLDYVFAEERRLAALAEEEARR